MKLRVRKRKGQDKHGFPTTVSWRDKGEWVPTETGVVFSRVTSGRCSVTSWPRQAWRGR